MLSSVCGVMGFLCSMEALALVGFGWAEARLGLAGAGEILGQVLGKQVWEGGGRGMVTLSMQWMTGWEPRCWQYQGGWEHWFPPAGSGRS